MGDSTQKKTRKSYRFNTHYLRYILGEVHKENHPNDKEFYTWNVNTNRKKAKISYKRIEKSGDTNYYFECDIVMIPASAHTQKYTLRYYVRYSPQEEFEELLGKDNRPPLIVTEEAPQLLHMLSGIQKKFSTLGVRSAFKTAAQKQHGIIVGHALFNPDDYGVYDPLIEEYSSNATNASYISEVSKKHRRFSFPKLTPVLEHPLLMEEGSGASSASGGGGTHIGSSAAPATTTAPTVTAISSSSSAAAIAPTPATSLAHALETGISFTGSSRKTRKHRRQY
jgi:hypothetical protein